MNANLLTVKALRAFSEHLSSLPPAEQKHWQLRYAELRRDHKVRDALQAIAAEMKECRP